MTGDARAGAPEPAPAPAQHGRGTGERRPGLRERTPLRRQLVIAVVVLAALAVAATSLAAGLLLRAQLLRQVDAQLQASVQPAIVALGQTRPAPSGSDDRDDDRDDDSRGTRGAPPPTSVAVAVLDPSGTVVRRIDPWYQEGGSGVTVPALTTSDVAEKGGEPFTIDGSSGSWRALALPVTGGSLVLALPLEGVTSTMGRLLLLDAVVGGVALLVLAVVARRVVTTSLRPLEEVETTAEAIAAGDLSRRVPPHPAGTEVGRLSTSLNTMLGQIETAFRERQESVEAARASATQARASEDRAVASAAAATASEARMRQFVADAGHELRTPLTSIRGFAELHRRHPTKADAEIDHLMSRIEADAARMGLLVEDLLLLARLDQQRPLERTPVDLLPLAADAVEDARLRAPGHTVRLRVTSGPVPPVVIGDEARLRQVLANLVTNAVTHTPGGTGVEVRLTADADDVVLVVVDDGPGMDAEDAARAFERFYRADPSRARTPGTSAGPRAPGSGLGLSIVRALVAAHGGTVTLDTAPGAGCAFTVRLPAAPTGDAVEDEEYFDPDSELDAAVDPDDEPARDSDVRHDADHPVVTDLDLVADLANGLGPETATEPPARSSTAVAAARAAAQAATGAAATESAHVATGAAGDRSGAAPGNRPAAGTDGVAQA